MVRKLMLSAVIAPAFLLAASAQQAGGPYKVLQRAKVGGEGGTDYIFADVVGRKIYITRGATRAVPATDSTPERPAYVGRVSVFDIETLKPLGEIPNGGGNGAVVDPKSGHGFASSHPDVTMFDTKTMQLIKAIPAGDSGASPRFSADGIYFDAFNDRVYVYSHPTHEAMVIDSHDGTMVGKIPLPGTPEQSISDGKGTLYVVMQDSGSVAVVDQKAMKAIKSYPFGGNTGCNGLALDAKNQVLFAACARTGPAPARGAPPVPSEPQMVILSAKDGKIITKLPLAGSSDGAAFNPATMEAFSAHGNGTMTIVKEKSPTEFEVEQNLETMNLARTLTLDTKTGHLFVMAAETAPAPAAAAGGRGGRGATIPGSFTIVMIGK
ncbi:MAG TPA: hypothetical protein VE967_09135 [Gemmatimonadaceae bacterium]|nr:hypothetical protein [Gemmatimonadaceae bacterium]